MNSAVEIYSISGRLESSFTEKNLGVLVFTMSQKMDKVLLGCIRKIITSRSREIILSL